MPIRIDYGGASLDLDIPPDRMVAVRREIEPAALADAAELYRSVLENPTRFPALRLALTPDDHVAIVVDDWHGLAEKLKPVLEHLREAHVRDENVTVVGPASEDLSPEIL